MARRERATRGAGPLPPSPIEPRALAMLGRFDEARAILAELRAELAERAGGSCSRTSPPSSPSGSSSGPAIPPPPRSSGAEGFGLHEELGERIFLSAAAGSLAQALYALDRLDEADDWAARAADLGASDDVLNEMLWRQVRAKVLAHRGEHAEAERLAREAVAMSERHRDSSTGKATRTPTSPRCSCSPAAPRKRPRRSSGRSLRFERKGNVVMAARMRDRLEALREEVRLRRELPSRSAPRSGPCSRRGAAAGRAPAAPARNRTPTASAWPACHAW